MLTSHELIGFMSPALANDILNFTFESDKPAYKATMAAVAETRKVDSGLVSAPGASGGASYRSAAYSPAAEAKMENNLDTVLVNQVKDEARKKGVSY